MFDQQSHYSIPSDVDTISVIHDTVSLHLCSFQVPYMDIENWGTISYYELNNRVGEQMKVT